MLRVGTQHPSATEKLLAGWRLCLGKMRGSSLPCDPTFSLHTNRGSVSEPTSVSVSSGRAPPGTPARSAGTHPPVRSSRDRSSSPCTDGGWGQVRRGGARVEDARSHAPTLGQTRKRRWRWPWGKMAPSGLKAVVGESECLPRRALASPGGRGPGAHGLWDPGGRELGAGRGVRGAPDTRGGGRGLGPSWTSRLSGAGAERSWETGPRGPKGIRLGVASAGARTPRTPTVPAGRGHGGHSGVSAGQSPGLDSWGPMVWTRVGLGALLSDPRWCDCSEGVSRLPFQVQGWGTTSSCPIPKSPTQREGSGPCGWGGGLPLPRLGWFRPQRLLPPWRS